MSLNVRISHKYDTYERWQESTIVLNAGELAIAAIPAQQTETGLTPPAIGIKVGDGEKTFKQLPWIQATAGDVYSWAKEANKPSYTAEEISGLEEFIAGEIQDTNTTYTFEYKNNQLIIKHKEATETEYKDLVALDIDLSTKVDKVEGTAGNIVNFGADGAIVDSGEKIGDFLKSATAAATYATIANLEKTDENVSKIDGRLNTAESEIDTLQEQIKGLTGAMHFEGTVDSDPTADGYDVEGYEAGDVVVYGDKEYVFHNGVFHELGDVSAEGTRLTALEEKVGEPAKDGAEATGLIKQMADAEAAIAELEEDAHTHGNQTELDKILDGDVAKWNGAQAAAEATAAAALALEAKAREDADKALQDRAKALEDVVGNADAGLVADVAANADAIESLGEELSTVAGTANTALQSISGVDGNKNGTDFVVTGVSVDLLKNGTATLVLNCGDSKTVI